MKISLIITTYNWKEALKLSLASGINQTCPPDEIIIADDGSRGDTRIMVESLAKDSTVPIAHIWQEDLGFRLAKSRNRAIAAARGNYIILIDGDIIMERHFVEDHRKAARSGFFVQGSRVLMSEKCSTGLLATNRLPDCFLAAGVANRKNCIRSPLLSRLFSRESSSYFNVRTCNFAFWKNDAVAVNGFDENFVGWGREDSEFTARLLNYGIRRRNIRFSATVYHLYHPINDRARLSHNDRLLQRTVEKRLTWCEQGLDGNMSLAPTLPTVS